MISKQMLDDMIGATRNLLGMLKQIQEHKEEKTKRDWEILALKRRDGAVIERGAESRFDTLVKLDGWDIYTVSRLSDGEVFSIGDEVRHATTGSVDVIKELKLGEYNLHTDDRKGLYVATASFGVYLEDVQKVVKPKPLFVDFNGKEIFEEDYWYSVSPQFYHSGMSRGLGWYNPDNGEKYFKTKEAAEEYILLNKKMFSINDLKEIIGKRDWIGRDFFIDAAKEKLSK